jgi:shikimate dehydrogenase
MFAFKGLAGECFYSACCGDILADVVSYITADSFRGASVTTPLKELVFAYLKESKCELSEDAKLAGAVNTVSLTESGALRGDNTDIVALRQVIQTSGNIARTCLIVGTGGAARGAIVAAKSSGFSTIYVHGRTFEKVQPLVDEFGSVPLVAAAGPVDVVIGCIPSAGQSDFVAQHVSVIGPSTTVVEMAYIPKVTPLVQMALNVGAQVVYGSEILIHQGIAQHEIWLNYLRSRNEFSGNCMGPSTELISQQLDMFSPE